MTLVVTVDEQFGLAFGARRQSRDRALTRDVADRARGRRIVTTEYSRLLFAEAEIDIKSIVFSDEPMKLASGDDVVFLELCVAKADVMKADEVIVYCWNRRYPSTAKLDMAPIEQKFKLEEVVDFAGNSHEKITRYVYAKA